jgi:4-azaleucine resistance transporter AzlC
MRNPVGISMKKEEIVIRISEKATHDETIECLNKKIPALKKLYLIWSLTDETYALEVENKVPAGENSLHYCLAVAVFDHLYWVIGVTAGAITGSSFNFDNRGIDFAMTALFLVILTDQCREKSNRLPAILGIVATLMSRVFFPPQSMLIPAMAVMIILLLVFRRQLDPSFKKVKGA